MRHRHRLPITDPRARLRLIASMVLVVPVLAMTALGLRYLDAQAVASAEAERLHWQRTAEAMARDFDRQTDDLARRAAAEMAAAYVNSEKTGLHGRYLSRADLAMVAIFAVDGSMLYPEEREMGLVTEQHYLRQVGSDLAWARQSAQNGGVSWARRASGAAGPVVACVALEAQTVCPIFRGESLTPTAEIDGALLSEASVPYPAQPGQRSVSAPLGGPFAGWLLHLDYPLRHSRDWQGLVAIAGPALLASAVALWLLARAHRAELSAERHKLDLLAGMSHELRTPLTNIRLFTALIAPHAGDPAKLRRHAEIIEHEVQGLSAIVDNALTVAATGTLRGGPLIVGDPDQRVRDILDRFHPSLGLAAPPELSLGGTGRVRFDAATLERVLFNLLDNVRRHAAGTTLTIATKYEDGRFCVTLRDRGPAPDVPAPVSQGFGLGLDACRRMAEAAQGRFTAAITPEGSRFTLELPAAALPTDEAMPCAS